MYILLIIQTKFVLKYGNYDNIQLTYIIKNLYNKQNFNRLYIILYSYI